MCGVRAYSVGFHSKDCRGPYKAMKAKFVVDTQLYEAYHLPTPTHRDNLRRFTVPTKGRAMDLRPDGRAYSRVTRRCVAIINRIREDRVFTIEEIADEIRKLNLPEFFLSRFNRQMSIGRFRSYIRYLVDLEVIKQQDDKYISNFQRKNTDGQWAQALSDIALLYLGKFLDKKPDDIFDYLDKIRSEFHKESRIPTVDDLVTKIGIIGTRNQEIFRWSLYMYVDGDACPFEIRRYPALLRSGAQEEESNNV